MFKSKSSILQIASFMLCSFSVGSATAAAPSLPISTFSEQSLVKWKHHSFSKNTDYGLVLLDNNWVLRAKSEDSASALIRSVNIDLEKTPILQWSWRVDKPLSGLDEKNKVGDDYAARVYVVHKKGFFDRGVAINYVWSGSNSKGSSWPNAYAMKSSYMLALQDSLTPLSQWQYESRNVREDFKSLLGLEVNTVQVVVLMTDTDNSGLDAEVYYGDLSFNAP